MLFLYKCLLSCSLQYGFTSFSIVSQGNDFSVFALFSLIYTSFYTNFSKRLMNVLYMYVYIIYIYIYIFIYIYIYININVFVCFFNCFYLGQVFKIASSINQAKSTSNSKFVAFICIISLNVYNSQRFKSYATDPCWLLANK